MALKIWDGFDHYGATADFLSRSGFLQYQLPSPQLTISFVTGRNGFGKAVKLDSGNSNSALRAVFGDRNAEAFFGQAMMIPAGTLASIASVYLVLMDNVAAAPQVTIYFNANNYSIQIFRGSISGTSIHLSANNVWTGDVWNYVEVRGKIDNSAGVIDVHINGVSVTSVSGVDTQATANAWFDSADFFVVPPPSGASFIWLDDFYYCDTTTGAGATAANTFLGDVRVATLFATGDDSVQWTPNSGANNFSRINEIAMDSDMSYVSTATATNQDTYVFQPLVNTVATIFGIQLTIAGRKDDAGSRVIKQVLKSGGTTDFGADHALPDVTYAYFTDQWILDPNTSANWTRTNVNAIEAGVNMVS